MELNIFMRNLQTALIRRGIPDETALKHVTNLRRTFTVEDLEEIDAIQSPEEIDQLADSIASILKKRQPAQPQTRTENPPAPRQPAAPARREETTFDDDLDGSFPEPAPAKKPKNRQKAEDP